MLAQRLRWSLDQSKSLEEWEREMLVEACEEASRKEQQTMRGK